MSFASLVSVAGAGLVVAGDGWEGYGQAVALTFGASLSLALPLTLLGWFVVRWADGLEVRVEDAVLDSVGAAVGEVAPDDGPSTRDVLRGLRALESEGATVSFAESPCAHAEIEFPGRAPLQVVPIEAGVVSKRRLRDIGDLFVDADRVLVVTQSPVSRAAIGLGRPRVERLSEGATNGELLAAVDALVSDNDPQSRVSRIANSAGSSGSGGRGVQRDVPPGVEERS